MPLKLLKELLHAVNPFSPSPPPPSPPAKAAETTRAPQNTAPSHTPDRLRPAPRRLEESSIASLTRTERPTWTPPVSIFGSQPESTHAHPESVAHAEVRAAKNSSKAKIREYANRALCNFQYSYDGDEPEPAPARKIKGRREL